LLEIQVVSFSALIEARGLVSKNNQPEFSAGGLVAGLLLMG
jgi:hypothetical protein